MHKSTVVLSCALAATAATAIWFWSQFQEQRSLHHDREVRGTSLECPGEMAATAPAVRSDLIHPEVVAARPMREMDAATPALPPGFRPSVQARLLKVPEFRKALHSQQRVNLEDDYRDLPKILGLTPEQSDQFFDLLAEQRIRMLDAQWVKPDEGRTAKAINQEAAEKNEAELASFLGPSNLSRYQDFRATLQSREEVNSVRNELARSPEPLRDDQVDPMIATVNVELQRMKQEMSDARAPGMGLGDDPAIQARLVAITIAANERIVDAARPILTSGQLAAMEELYRRQRLQMQAESDINRLRTEAAFDDTPAAAPH